MANPTVVTLTKDVWTKVLTDVTFLGKVSIIDQDNDPTLYLATFVDTGDPAPAVDFAGGTPFLNSVSPSNNTGIDVYVMPKTFNGRVTIAT